MSNWKVCVSEKFFLSSVFKSTRCIWVLGSEVSLLKYYTLHLLVIQLFFLTLVDIGRLPNHVKFLSFVFLWLLDTLDSACHAQQVVSEYNSPFVWHELLQIYNTRIYVENFYTREKSQLPRTTRENLLCKNLLQSLLWFFLHSKSQNLNNTQSFNGPTISLTVKIIDLQRINCCAIQTSEPNLYKSLLKKKAYS